MTEASGRSVPLTVSEADGRGGTTDTALLEQGYVSVTALRPVVEDLAVSFTALVE